MIPLSAFSTVANPALRAHIEWRGPDLTLRYELRDPLGLVRDGLQAGNPTRFERADGLWKTTCFEAFFAVPGEPSYWEFNIAGDGARWNLYRFDSYRAPEPPRASFDFELARSQVSSTHLECALRSRVSAARLDLEASLTAVIRTDAGTHYFSSYHAGEKPDFHLREGLRIFVTHPSPA